MQEDLHACVTFLIRVLPPKHPEQASRARAVSISLLKVFQKKFEGDAKNSISRFAVFTTKQEFRRHERANNHIIITDQDELLDNPQASTTTPILSVINRHLLRLNLISSQSTENKKVYYILHVAIKCIIGCPGCTKYRIPNTMPVTVPLGEDPQHSFPKPSRAV